MNVRLRSQLMTVGLAAVLTVPYAAPATCELFGAMGPDMEMVADDYPTVGMSGGGTIACSVQACGIPRVGPVSHALDVPLQVSAVRAEIQAPPAARPIDGPVPLIPPPQA